MLDSNSLFSRVLSKSDITNNEHQFIDLKQKLIDYLTAASSPYKKPKIKISTILNPNYRHKYLEEESNYEESIDIIKNEPKEIHQKNIKEYLQITNPTKIF